MWFKLVEVVFLYLLCIANWWSAHYKKNIKQKPNVKYILTISHFINWKKLKYKIPFVFMCIYFLWSIVCIYTGIVTNLEFKQIKEKGTIITAYIKENGYRKEKYLATQTTQYLHVVKIDLNGVERTIKMLSTEYFHAGDKIDVYYLPDVSEDGKVVAVNEIFYPGNNLIELGINRIVMGVIFYFLLKNILKKNRNC